MKSIILIIVLVSISSHINSQGKYKDKPATYEESLKNDLIKAQGGKALGTALIVGGGITLGIGANKLNQAGQGSGDPDYEKNDKAITILGVGCALMAIGIAEVIINRINEKGIKAELVRFTGPTSQYGIGIEMKF